MIRTICSGSPRTFPVSPRFSEPGRPYGVGECPACHKRVGLQKSGKLMEHGRLVVTGAR